MLFTDLSIPQMCGLIGLCFIVLFTILTTYDIIIKLIRFFCKTDDGWSDSTTLDIRVMIYINLFVILLHIITTTLNLILSTSDLYCKIFTRTSVLSFDLSRAILYMILVRRTAIIFEDTVFGLSNIRKYLFYALTAIYCVPYIIYLHLITIQPVYNAKYGCLVQYSPHILTHTSSGAHILIIMYSLYLFTNPVYKLIKLQENTQVRAQLNRVMIKYIILHITSVCSSIVLIILSFMFPFGYNYSIIDACLNGMILILLHPLQNRVYKLLCCFFHFLCLRICNVPKNTAEVTQTPAIPHMKSPAVIEPPSIANPQTPETSHPDMQTDAKSETDQAVIESLPNFKIVIEPHELIRVPQKSPGDDSMDPVIDRANTTFDDIEALNDIEPIIELPEYDTNNNTNKTNTSSRMSSFRMSVTHHLSVNDVSLTLQYAPSTDSNLDLERKASNTLKLIKFESYQL